MSDTRDALLTYLVHAHGFTLEVPFRGLSGTRRWRWDAARLNADETGGVAVEYQGFGPGHQWSAGMERDMEKLSEGQLCGWTVIVCGSSSVNSGRCYELVELALADAGLLVTEIAVS
jgi:hypothetical protein